MLAGYGARVQLSVFECELPTSEEVRRLTGMLEALIEPIEDQVRLYPVPANALRDVRILGSRTLEERADYWIV